MGNRRTVNTGRGANVRPPNRFERTTRVVPLDLIDPDEGDPAERSNPATEFHADLSRSVVSENQSPDVGFRYSLNPYRGCEHGCVYCYARPTHEYLGFNAGLDFERRIMVKDDAPALLRETFLARRWQPQVVA